MGRRPHRPLLLLLLLTFFFAVLSLLAGGASAAGRKQKPPSSFISAACQNTLYPDDCISCLSSHAAAIGNRGSNRRLARAALREALTQAKSASATVNRLSSSGDGSSRRPSVVSPDAGAAVSDCTDRLSNCVWLLWRSLWRIEHLGSRGTARYRYNLSSVQTWVSAALTDQTTCLDGFPASSGVHTNKDAAVKNEISGVVRMTSVVLALVRRIDGAQQ